MCKKYINDKIEDQIIKALHRGNKILFPPKGKDVDTQGHMSVRDARAHLLSARAHISNALWQCGKIERIRKVRIKTNDK